MPPWIAALLVVVATYGFLLVFAWRHGDEILFQPREASYGPGEPVELITGKDGQRLATVFLEAAKARLTILYLHGNACDIGDVMWLLEDMQSAGYNVAAVDYRGYGLSPGVPSEAGVYADAEAALRHLVDVRGLAPEQIVLYGHSMGSGPGVELALRHPVAGLVLEGAFVSAYRVVTRVPLLPGDRFVNIRKIGRVRCPVLVMHGRRDQTVSFWHGEALFRAASEPKMAFWVDEAGHNDLAEVAGEAYWEKLAAFSTLVLEGRRRPERP